MNPKPHRIRNPVTGHTYEIRPCSSKAGTKQIRGLWATGPPETQNTTHEKLSET